MMLRRILLTVCLSSVMVLPVQGQQNEELENYYKKWLEEDVHYIITPEEEETFLNLSTDLEKEAFIEQFWFRRDPDKRTSINEFREEHYRRIAYANENFHSGTEGWRSDRGFIYIKFGPPTGIEKKPEGGAYVRKASEGGGFTSTYPFEVWFYNYIEGVGEGIEIEFVDPLKTNQYRFAIDSDDKDAHLYVAGAGETEMERLGLQTRRNRLRVRGIGNQEDTPLATGMTSRMGSMRDMPFERLATMYRLQKAPSMEYRDLERIVSTRVNYDQLPVIYRADRFQVTPTVSLIPITLFLANRDLTFAPTDEAGLVSTDVIVYGQLETVTGRVTYVFEDTISNIVQPSEVSTGYSIFQKRLPFQEPGKYKLSIVVQDEHSERMATLSKLIEAPDGTNRGIFASTLILATEVAPVESFQNAAEPFVLGNYKVVPAADNRFQAGNGSAQVFFEVYNFELDQASLQPAGRIEISLLKGTEIVFPFVEIQHGFEFDGNTLVVNQPVPFRGLEPSSYMLRFRVTDEIRQETVEAQTPFIIAGTSGTEQ